MASRCPTPYESEVVRLIDQLYEAATAPALWPDFLKSFFVRRVRVPKTVKLV